MSLATVDAVIDRARVLLQDTIEEYRYSNSSLVGPLSDCLLEIRRLRPELVEDYFTTSLPEFTCTAEVITANQPILIDEQFRVAMVYYVCGMAQLRDEENTQDSRATIFLNKFVAQMQSMSS